MCLYPKLLINKKYVPTKKNNYNPPPLTDTRVKYVAVGCGNCIECKQQKAREWQIRLAEELKNDQTAHFVTLTFSNEAFLKLCEESGQKADNYIAGFAVRRFLERWRKKYKKSVKHWLITELGHNNTERLHLHGLIWQKELTNEILTNIWQYGFADAGQYVNTRTINYIIKYVTKVDLDHKDYKAQIFCSAGLGKSYINTNTIRKHIYNANNTNETYTYQDGHKGNLPIYYRNKLFDEETREQLWKEKIEKAEIYVRGIKIDISTEQGMQNYTDILADAQKFNERAGYGTDAQEWKKKEYNHTLRMINAKSKLQNTRKNGKNIT